MKKILCILLSLGILFTLSACSKKVEQIKEPTVTTQTTTKPVVYYNPYTGKEGYNKNAVGKRPVALVVENQYYARPQWGIKTPDIIVEGEVEGGISRMLWIYADYTAVPEKVGPTRSARPSYVKISELFDAVFIHWGGSGSNGAYVGGYDTIKRDCVDDLDGIAGGELFGRDTTRNTAIEHRGVIYGNKIPNVLKNKKIRTDTTKDKFTKFDFYEKATSIQGSSALTVRNKFAGSTDTRAFKYSAEDKKYHSSDWETDVAFTNLIILKDRTDRYTVGKKGVTYVNYALSGGSGYLVSQGEYKTVKWDMTSGKLVLTDAEGKPIKLNKGRTYIGLSSSDDGGKVEIKGEQPTSANG